MQGLLRKQYPCLALCLGRGAACFQWPSFRLVMCVIRVGDEIQHQAAKGPFPRP